MKKQQLEEKLLQIIKGFNDLMASEFDVMIGEKENNFYLEFLYKDFGGRENILIANSIKWDEEE